MRVPISAIIDGMEVQSDEMHSYLHRPTGRVSTITDDAFAAAQEDDREWVTPEELQEARAVLRDEGEYLALPDRFEINEYRMMERFARNLPGDAERDATLRSIKGRGAFRYFKDTVHDLGLAEAWYAFRDDGYRSVARRWCEENGIDYDDSAPANA